MILFYSLAKISQSVMVRHNGYSFQTHVALADENEIGGFMFKAPQPML